MENKSRFKQFLSSRSGKIVMIIILYGILLCLLTLATEIVGDTGGLIIGIICGIFGWKALNKIRPNVFLIMPVIGWFIYFCIKGILSVMIGCFVAPFVIAKWITEKIQIGE